MGVANLAISGNQQGNVNKFGINPGWSVQEDSTPTDMLDSSGSTGQVSATFKKVAQTGVGGKPSDAPIKSSTYLLDQTADFIHPELGYIHGNISNVRDSGANVDLQLDSIMNSLNIDIDAAPFVDGGVFYSFTQADLPTISGMAVDAAGDIWVAGRASQVSKYYHFGGPRVDFFNLPANGKNIEIDSSGNLYVLGNFNIYKVNISTRAVTTITTLGSGSYVDFAMDSSNFIYAATTDTTANSAIKKYNSSGTLQTTWGDNNLSLGIDTPSSFQTITGISAAIGAASSVYVSSQTPLNLAAGLSATVQIFSNTGTYISTTQLTVNEDYNNIWMEPIPPKTGSVWNMLTVTARGINLSTIPGNGWTINNDFIAPRLGSAIPPFGDMAIASDRSGMGFYVAVNNKITRIAGGKLSPYQALECYIGLTGFTQVSNGVLNYTNTTSAQRNVFDGYFPAWSGNAWTYIKQLVSSRKIFLTTSGYSINITDWTRTLPRLNIDERISGIQRDETTATAQQINVTNLNTRQVSDIYVSIPGDPVISADYNEINTTTIAVNAYPASIDPVLNLQGTTPPTGGSFYMVSDSSNPPLILSAGQFIQAGGSVIATKSETLGSIDITVNGPTINIPGFIAPFSLAYPVGNQKVSALSISGNAVKVSPIVLSVLTGASPSVTFQVNSSDLSSPFIESGNTAYTVAHEAACRVGSAELTLSFSIPRRTTNLFGSIAGSYFIYNRLKWRVSSAQVYGDVIRITAKRFTNVLDTTPNPTITVATHDALWSGFRIQDNFLSPGIATT